MAYEALYRRYRPSRFQDAFFGQDHVVAALRNAIEGDRVGHAYLFSGPRGTGKTTSARILAKRLTALICGAVSHVTNVIHVWPFRPAVATTCMSSMLHRITAWMPCEI